MKSTAERLYKIYSIQTTDEEWKLLNVRKHSFNRNNTCVIMGDKSPIGWIAKSAELNGFDKIPVSHFIDLLQDRIAPWRLEEDGFEYDYELIGRAEKTLENGYVVRCKFANGKHVMTSVSLDKSFKYEFHYGKVDTYTQLLTLIELIG